MRARTLLAAAIWASLAATGAAIPYIPPPQPVYEAPIDRALQNVLADESMEPLRRELLLARLNLLAYARDDGDFTYLSDGDAFNETGSVPCSEAPRNMRHGDDGVKPESFGPDERCAAINYNIGPRQELPGAAPEEASAAALERLHAACTHYERALELDGDNLRARLGYAYVLDRLGRMGPARVQLNQILDRGLPRLAEARSDWDDHVVLTEAAAHLAHIATTRALRTKMSQLRARLEASQPMIYVTPVLVPLSDAPFARLIDRTSNVAFDFAGTGDARAQGWLTPDAAWLVWDPEWRGEVRSGFDMIGQRTWSVFWRDGFEALRALDDNRDGQLTGAELGGLALWRDANNNGVSEPGEVLPANVHGIAALAVRGTPERPDLITAPDGVRFEDGRTRPLYDWTPGLAGPVS